MEMAIAPIPKDGKYSVANLSEMAVCLKMVREAIAGMRARTITMKLFLLNIEGAMAILRFFVLL